MPTQRKKTAPRSAKRLTDLKDRLGRAKREEDVKAAWAKALSLDYDTSEDIDLYTPQMLFEFKHVAALTQAARCAQVLADRDLGAKPLAKLKAAHDLLRGKLVPSVEGFGFLR